MAKRQKLCKLDQASDRRLEASLAAIEQNAASRCSVGAWGEFTVTYKWEAGKIKEVVFVSRDILRDVPENPT